MADPAELTPAELDRIEDALEGLDELEDDPKETSAIVQRRLAEYREILRMSRTALPLEEVPAGVLDGVLAHARESADAVTLDAPVKPQRASWWQRWRGMLLVPGIAMASAAVLVLVLGVPSGPDEATSDTRVAQLDASIREEAAEAKREAKPDATPMADEEAEPAAAAAAAEDALAIESDPAEAKQAAGEPAPAGYDAASAGPRWDIVARGDRARRDGDCERASAEYAMALTDDDTHVRARAYAGLGLCDAAEGRFKEASDRYQRAKELDPEMEAFIEQQRPRGSAGGGGKATRAKRAAPRPASSSKKSSSDKPMPKAQQAFE